MAAAKKGLLKTWYDEFTDIYGKENLLPVLCRGAAIGIVYVLWELSKLEPLPKPDDKGGRHE